MHSLSFFIPIDLEREKYDNKMKHHHKDFVLSCEHCFQGYIFFSEFLHTKKNAFRLKAKVREFQLINYENRHNKSIS